MDNPILCIDFDGVIHDYRRGWQGGVIYGELTPGFLDWAHKAGKLFKLVVYSSRSKKAEGVVAMSDWITRMAQADGWEAADFPFDGRSGDPMLRLVHLGLERTVRLYFTHEKPPAFLTIDDRCVRFEGSWDAMAPQMLRDFKPWSFPDLPVEKEPSKPFRIGGGVA